MELGSTVTLAYRGTLDDGTVFGFADAHNPLIFQTGMDMVIEGLEEVVLSMNDVGEKKSVSLNEYQAYGEYLEGYTQRIPLEQIPVGSIVPGKRVWLANSEDGAPMPATVLEVTDGEAVFDLNHPLAGKNLNFELEILGIEPPPDDFVSAAEKARHMREQSKLLGGDMGEDFR